MEKDFKPIFAPFTPISAESGARMKLPAAVSEPPPKSAEKSTALLVPDFEETFLRAALILGISTEAAGEMDSSRYFREPFVTVAWPRDQFQAGSAAFVFEVSSLDVFFALLGLVSTVS